jgi:hypothetical protein
MLPKRTISICLAIIALAGAASAQPIELTPRLAQECTAAARTEALSALAQDAVPVLVGAVGNDTYDFNGNLVPLRFYLEDGRSTSWAFSFYSPSLNQRMLIAVVDIPSVGLQAFPTEAPVPIPDLTAAVDLTAPFAGSDAAMARLAADSVYKAYRAELPARLPEAIALRMPNLADSATVPAWFPLDRPIWAMNFTGQGSDAMMCYIASGTGATYCIRATAASVDEGRGVGPKMDLSKR